jgi:hypothetical protein
MVDLVTRHGIYVFLAVRACTTKKMVFFLAVSFQPLRKILAVKVNSSLVWCNDGGKKGKMDGWKRTCVKHSGNPGRNWLTAYTKILNNNKIKGHAKEGAGHTNKKKIELFQEQTKD